MHRPGPASPAPPEPHAKAFYQHSMRILNDAGIPFVVGGGYALAYHTGVVRHTKDFDAFIRHDDLERAIAAFEQAGYRTERTWPHFLAKALHKDCFIDLLYSSANGMCPVDKAWFDHAGEGDVLEMRALVCPAEEILWQKVFIQDRDRFDGADVAHMILAKGHELDWDRLMQRLAGHERLLLAHLMLFGYIYPTERAKVPPRVIEELLQRVADEPTPHERVCQGTYLSKDQYLFDVRNWGFVDPRLVPEGPLTRDDIATLTAA